MNRPRALVVAWEAASWQLLHPLLDRGEMPNLHSLLERGTMGTLAAPLPLEHGLLWASLATGRRSGGHGILGSAVREGDPAGGRPSLAQRNCPAFWDLLQRHGLKTHLINWPMTDASEKTGGACVSDRFFEIARFRQSASAAEIVSPPKLTAGLRELRVDPAEVDDATLRFFVPDLDRASREHDLRLQKLARAVARTLSVQAVATRLMANQPWDVVVVRFELIAELAPWALPLAPPKLDLVGQLEFDLYREVLDHACRGLDLMLGALVNEAGSDAIVAVVSDRGLTLGEARPVRSPGALKDAAKWKHREGLFVLAGSGTRADEVVRGARALDLMPTLLAALGLTIPSELEGSPLMDAFAEPPQLSFAPLDPPWAPQCALPVPPLNDDEPTIRRAWNLARAQLDGGRVKEALALLEDLCRLRPDDYRYMQAQFECQLALRRVAEARETLEPLLDRAWGTPQASLWRARLEYAARRFDESLRRLADIESRAPSLPRLHLQVGLNLVKLNQSARARASFERELQVRPGSAEARAGLAYCCLRAGEFDEAAEHALKAIHVDHQAYYAHFLLGLAQARRDQIEPAIMAFRTAVALVPAFAPGHRCLALLYARSEKTQELAQRHRQLAQATRHWNWGF